MSDTLESLIADLASPDRLRRSNAVWSLMDLGEAARPALPGLRLLLEDNTEPYIRISAAGTIRRIVPKDLPALAVLVEGLRDPVGLHRATACEFLGETGDKSSVLRVMALLGDPDFSVRFAASVAIGQRFNDWLHAVAVCVAMPKVDDEHNRSLGKQCLLRIGRQAKAHMDLLSMALVDVWWEARIDIEEALDELRRL